jgi:hypothetical protein
LKASIYGNPRRIFKGKGKIIEVQYVDLKIATFGIPENNFGGGISDP